MEPQVLEATQSVFDLDTKSDVTLFKQVNFTPATDTQEALSRVGNDASTFMKIVNAGLRTFTLDQAKEDTSIPWTAKDDEGNPVPFSGTTISEEKSKQLDANVLNMAKMLFGYEKGKAKEEKRVAKEKALAMLLDNPAVIEGLRAGK